MRINTYIYRFLACLLALNLSLPFPLTAQTSSANYSSNTHDLTHFRLPSQWGTVEEKKFTGSQQTVFLIQDAHAIGDAQKSIQHIVQYLSEKYGLSLFGLEGAQGALDTDFFKAFPDPYQLKKVFEGYVQTGEISGAAAAAVLHPKEAAYVGLEDAALYEESIHLFLSGLDAQASWKKELEEFSAHLANLKKKYYSRQLRAFEAKRRQLESENKILEVLASLKALFTEEILVGRPHLDAVFDQLHARTEKALHSQLEAEAKKIRPFLAQTEIAAFNQKKQLFKTEQISEEDYAAYLAGLLTHHHQPVPFLIQQAADQSQFLKQLRGDLFMEELQGALQQIEQQFLKTESQKILSQTSRQFDQLHKLIHFTLSRKDWEVLKKRKEEGEEGGRKEEGGWRKGKKADDAEILQAEAELNKISHELLSGGASFYPFYVNAESREQALYENLFQTMKKQNAHNSVMVAGGFHAQGILERLTHENISYVLITPSIQKLEGAEKYFDYMKGEVSWKNYFQIQNGRIRLYDAFARAARDRLLESPKSAANSPLIKAWRDNLLRRLASQGKIAHAGRYTLFLDEKIKNSAQDQENLKQQWQARVQTFLRDLKTLKNENRLTPENLSLIIKQPLTATAQHWNAVPLVYDAGMDPAWVRSELREREDYHALEKPSPSETRRERDASENPPKEWLRLLIQNGFIEKVPQHNLNEILNLLITEGVNDLPIYLEAAIPFHSYSGALYLEVPSDDAASINLKEFTSKEVDNILTALTTGIAKSKSLSTTLALERRTNQTFYAEIDVSKREKKFVVVRPESMQLAQLLHGSGWSLLYQENTPLIWTLNQSRTLETFPANRVFDLRFDDSSHALVLRQYLEIRAEAREAAVEIQEQAHWRRALGSKSYVDRAKLHNLKNTTIVSLQMEAGYFKSFLEFSGKNFGSQVRRWLAQVAMTGGLGALMHDLIPAWASNFLSRNGKADKPNVIGISPLWDTIKAYPPVGESDKILSAQKAALQNQMKKNAEEIIAFDLNLTWSGRFDSYAEHWRNKDQSPSRALQIMERANRRFKKVYVEVSAARHDFYAAPQYYLDAYVLNDETKPNTEDNRTRIFNEIYSDDYPWRDIQMAVYGQAAEILIEKLQEKKIIHEQIAEIHNEVFVSVPKKSKTKRNVTLHINHSAYLPTVYSPSEASYRLLGFKEWMRPDIVRQNKQGHPVISIVDYVALTYDQITGVSMDEHLGVLREKIFRNAIHKVHAYRYDGMRTTNGVLTEQWRGAGYQRLLDHARRSLGLSPEAEEKKLFAALREEKNDSIRKALVERLGWVKAAYAAVFLTWLKEERNQTEWYDKLLKDVKIDSQGLISFQTDILTSAESGNWEKIFENKTYQAIKDALLAKSIISNARRWVPYKGPEKWLEILRALEGSPEMLEEFRQKAGRHVIAGRTFGPEGSSEFQDLKNLILKLKLEDQFVTLDDYNIDEAPILFYAMSGVVMLSDEFLEASATSMEKGLVNGAALISVWGGASPELFHIANEHGRKINIFRRKTSHDRVVNNLETNRWSILNGFLIRYSEETSNQAGGGRRPLTDSLLEAVYGIQQTYQDPENRQKMMWEAFAASPDVHIREGQARAHLHFLDKLIPRVKNDREKRETLKPGAEQALIKILNFKKDFHFYAVAPPGRIEQVGKTSHDLVSFIQAFKQLKTDGLEERRGEHARQSLRYHALRTAKEAPAGDIFEYLKNMAAEISSINSHYGNMLDELGGRAAKDLVELGKLKQKVNEKDKIETLEAQILEYNLQALEWTDQYLLLLAGWAIEERIRAAVQKDATRAAELTNTIFSHKEIRRYMARYLDEHPDAEPLRTEDVRSFLFRPNGSKTNSEDVLMISLNVEAIAYPDPKNHQIKKAWGSVRNDEVLENHFRLLGVLPENKAYVNFSNAETGEKHRNYRMIETRGRIPVGISEPSGFEALRMKKQDNETVYAAITAHENSGTADFVAHLIHAIQEQRNNPEKLQLILSGLVQVGEQTLRDQGLNIKAFMALIAGLEPKLLDELKSWDLNHYLILKRVTHQFRMFIQPEKRHFAHTPEDLQRIVFVYSDGKQNGENLIFSIDLMVSSQSPSDGKKWGIVRNIKANGAGVQVDLSKEYVIANVLTGEIYPRFWQGRNLIHDWSQGIPVEERRNHEGVVIQEGRQYDIYQILPHQQNTPMFELYQLTEQGTWTSLEESARAVQVSFLEDVDNFFNQPSLTPLQSHSLHNDRRESFETFTLQRVPENNGKHSQLLVVLNHGKRLSNSEVIITMDASLASFPTVYDFLTGEKFEIERKGNRFFVKIPMPPYAAYRLLSPAPTVLTTSPILADLSRSELRTAILPVIEALAKGNLEEAGDVNFFIQHTRTEWASVAENFETEAIQSEYFQIYGHQAAASFYAAHSSVDQDLDQAVGRILQGMEQNARAQLSANPKAKLNYAFAFSLELADQATRERILKLIETVQAITKLQRNYPEAEIEGNIRVLLSPSQNQDEALASFREKVDASGVAKRIVMNEAGKLDLERFLKENPPALVYGVTHENFSPELQSQIVASEVTMDLQLPVALVMTDHLARYQFQIQAETLGKITEIAGLHQILIWNGASPFITSEARNFIYQDYLSHQYISTMA